MYVQGGEVVHAPAPVRVHGADAEMAIDAHYSEVMDVIDRLFVYMFNGIASRCGK